MSDAVDSTSRKRARIQPVDRAAYPRKRAVQACFTCRRRRTKCDNETPSCTSCLNLGIQCAYGEKDKSTFDSASLAILERLDGLEQLIWTANPDTLGPRRQVIEQTSPLTLKNLESPALQEQDVSALCYINIETILSWPVFADQALEERNDLRSLLQSTSLESEFAPLSITSDFETNGAPKLLKSFFEDVHIYNPILEVERIEQYARAAQFHGLGWDSQSCLLLLAYALGSISRVQEILPSKSSFSLRQTEDFRNAEGFFAAAQKRMGILLCRSGVVEAQCFFLAGAYLMATFRPIEAWKMFVQALACCQGFATIRKPHDPTSEDELQRQESIYWTCFKSELELRLELNIAKNSIWDLTYPAFFPSPPKGLKAQGEVIWYYYLAEIALRRLGNRILNYVYQFDSSQTSIANTVEAISNFEQQADGWLASLPPSLHLDSTTDGADETADSDEPQNRHASLRFILSGHLLDCYEMMYWPFIVDAIHGTLLNDINSQSFARKGLLICKERIEKNESGFYKRHHGTWLMLRSCTRSTLVLIGAFRAGLANLLPEGWPELIEKVMQMLRYWKDEVGDAADRLDVLENLMKDVSP